MASSKIGETSATRFLAGGGEMGARMRATDWSATPLGPPEHWPQSLKTVIRIVLTSRYAMWMLWGPDLTFFCNDAYLPTLGVKKWVLGERADKVWAEIWPEVGPRVDSVLQTEVATYDENLMLFLERSGYTEETYHTFSYSPLSDDQGTVVGLLCVVTEETQKVIGERRLALLGRLGTALTAVLDEDDLFKALREICYGQADMPFIAGCLKGADGPMLSGVGVRGTAFLKRVMEIARPRMVDLPGGPRIDIIALPENLKTTSGPWDKPPKELALVPFMQAGANAVAGYLLLGLNPYRPYDQDYARFLELLAGQVGATLTNVRAHEAERRRAASLAEIDRAKTIFFSNVSHEFRTPLTLMLAPLEELLTESESLPEAATALLTVAHRNAIRLLRLVNALLDFSRIEAGRAQAVYTRIDLPALTAELASNFRSAINRAGLTLTIDCPPLPMPVYVDRDMWEKIVLNLISNAFKFTFTGGITVRVRALADGSGVEATVSDTGTGIPDEELPRLFERFHRIEGARGRSVEGTGIGLSLVHELVKLHGGRLHVESKVNEGSRFSVTLPFGRGHLPADAVRERSADGGIDADMPLPSRAQAFVTEALRWLEPGNLAGDGTDVAVADDAARAQTATPYHTRARIIFADDNADMREYVRRLLAQRFDVVTVGDGEAALDAVRAHPPALLLTDVMMPKLDGFGLLAAIRADSELQDLPVILLSARAGEEARVEGLNAGADDYLTKPFAARELLARVGGAITLARTRKEAEIRLRAATDGAAMGVFEWDIEHDRPSWENERVYQIFGRSTAEGPISSDEFINGMMLPEDKPAYHAALKQSLQAGGPFKLECRIRRQNDGEVRWLEMSGVAEQGADGKATRMVGVVADITPRRQAEEHVAFLLREVNHRAKNLLALVQAVARQTSGGDPKEFATRFGERLAGLAACQNLLVESEWTGVDANTLVRSQLNYFKDILGDRIILQGPPTRIGSSAAQTLSMAIHELATNAAKYGALSRADGKVRIGWDTTIVRGRQVFSMTWVEENSPIAAPPKHKGFGHRVLVQTVELSLDGEVKLDYASGGLTWRVVAPLERVIERAMPMAALSRKDAPD